MNDPLPPGSTIGILGGGQLGRMLAMAAARFSYRTIILEPGADCPAAQLANRRITASYDDDDALGELADNCDVVTYEFENVPVGAANYLQERVPVHPPPAALEVAQDRLVEKQFLNDAGIPTAPFLAVDNDEDLQNGLSRFGGNGVLKTRRLGYDGKGQHVFCKASPGRQAGMFDRMGSVPLILEAFMPFEREFSIIAARGKDGSVAAYDPPENIHRDGILRTSTVPALIAASAAEAARDHVCRLMEKLDYVGVVGVEFFSLADGAIAANEFAPRVHNSGHWTEAACAISQFEQHVRAIAGLPLGATTRHSNCVMQNLIGDEVENVPELAKRPDVILHLYGKADVRPGRKMGHATTLSPLVRSQNPVIP